MKRFVALFVLMLSIFQAWALQVTVKSFQLRPSDLAARENVRTDAKGTDCAMIRVQVVGINDLQFEEAVGKTNYGHGEYMVLKFPTPYFIGAFGLNCFTRAHKYWKLTLT